MTQTEQTTAERLLALIANNQQTIRSGGIELLDHGRASNLIAAEIDAKDAQLAQANEWLSSGVVKIERLEAQLADERKKADRVISELETQIAEARAQIAIHIQNETNYQQAAKVNEGTIAALTPKAEAWGEFWKVLGVIRPGWGACSDITGVIERHAYRAAARAREVGK